MALREVIRMGNPILRQVAQAVTREEILSSDFKILIKDMFDTMAEEDGIGIAAPQIGISKKVAIVGVPKDNPRYLEVEMDEDDEDDFDVVVVVNPKITVLDDSTMGFWEGCLSVPGLRGYVERPSKIRVDFMDLDGEEQTLEVEGFGAIVFQHELDHLDGVLYVDRVKDNKLSFNDEYMQFHADE